MRHLNSSSLPLQHPHGPYWPSSGRELHGGTNASASSRPRERGRAVIWNGLVLAAVLALGACGGGQPAQSPTGTTEGASASPGDTSSAEPSDRKGAGDHPSENEFALRDSNTAGDAHGATPSKIKPTESEAAMKFVVVDKDKGPIEGIVISLTAPDGTKYYTEETDPTGYAEVLVPVGQKYELVYLSLGRRKVAANVAVSDEPNQNIKLTLRYKRHSAPAKVASGKGSSASSGDDSSASSAPGFVLKGVTFDTAKSTIRPESYERLESVIEFMTHTKSARIEISGHTDNVGDPKANKALSERRAKAVRDYLISKGIDGSRIEAVGYGEERPVAPNDTEKGRQQNRRIEATEI